MTPDNPSRPSESPRVSERQGSGEVRFSPNFSVYVLPPDVVCLYSETRKVFLHGELYCALASRIGAGERREAIVSVLSREFPAVKIDEAFKRLLDRGFVVPANLIDGMAAGYWASLGLGAESAAQNLAKIGVRILPATTAVGASELDATLREFGVRVVDHSAELTVVLVDDYLDRKLADFNRERLAQKQEWLLAQPSGVFPLVGPIFSPGKSACWTCLADRMKWNRQIKAFLDRKEARCVVASPLGENVVARSAIGLAAIEIVKAVASGFRTDLHHHVVSLDLLASTVVRHHVPARPQCPSCGSQELRDPARVAAPIRLRAGGRAVMTSRGYRSVAPAETVARFRKHVSPLTGVVSQLERIKSEQPGDLGFLARHNFAPRPEALDAPQARLIGDSYGKGSTAEECEASALMHAVERYCGIFQGDEIRTTRRFADFPAGDAILPNDILLLSEAQHAQGRDRASRSGEGWRFDPSAEMEWSPVWSLRDERFKHLPTGLLYFFHDASGDQGISADTNGCAAGNRVEEAIVHGFLELIERDACAIWWYNRLRRAEIDLDELGDDYLRDARARFAAMGRGLRVLDVTSDLGIPAVVAVAHWQKDARDCVRFAAGAHFDLRIATLRAVTKLNQSLTVDRMAHRPGGQPDEDGDALPVPLRKTAYLLPHGKAPVRRARSSRFASLDRREQVLACVKLARRFGLDFLVLDQTRPDIQVPVVRVIVPGLRHLYRRFAPGRLYDVPVKLGLRKRPLQEAELNPLDPRT
jgi:bacteriocin biosynthesis cyclodehydratase domain-containing protein